MTELHDDAHEPLLAAVLAGELDLPAAAAAPIRSCERCRAELEGMASTTALLDEAGRERRELLEATVDPATAHPVRQPVRRRPWLLFAAAAALLMVTAVVAMRWLDGPPDGVPDGKMLLHGRVDVDGFEPAGVVAGDEAFPFTWRDASELLDPTYRVEVREIDSDGRLSAAPIAASKWLRAHEWRPEEHDRARIRACASIQWQVIARDMTTPGEVRLPAIVARWR